MNNQSPPPCGSAARRRNQPIHLAPIESWDRAPLVFVTACTAHRQPLLDHQLIHELITGAWREANEWQVGRYVMMPDHVHFFCSPVSAQSRALEKWMQYWKSLVTKRWPDSHLIPIWQASHWDRQLRREENYDTKWEYVRQNPVRRGLAQRPEEWLYQGQLNELVW